MKIKTIIPFKFQYDNTLSKMNLVLQEENIYLNSNMIIL